MDLLQIACVTNCRQCTCTQSNISFSTSCDQQETLGMNILIILYKHYLLCLLLLWCYTDNLPDNNLEARQFPLLIRTATLIEQARQETLLKLSNLFYFFLNSTEKP